MFTNRQILDFCNLQMDYHRNEFVAASNSVPILKTEELAYAFIYQHALEGAGFDADVLVAVRQWWLESDFNTGHKPFKL